MSLNGYWGSDDIELKGEDDENGDKLELEDFEFFLITHVNPDSSRKDLDGVIGLGAS